MHKRLDDVVDRHNANRDRNRRALGLLYTAVEVREGGIRQDDVLGPDAAVQHVAFSFMKDAPLSRGVMINGELYVSAIDAGAMDGRDRTRMLAVARAVANNG